MDSSGFMDLALIGVAIHWLHTCAALYAICCELVSKKRHSQTELCTNYAKRPRLVWRMREGIDGTVWTLMTTVWPRFSEENQQEWYYMYFRMTKTSFHKLFDMIKGGM